MRQYIPHTMISTLLLLALLLPGATQAATDAHDSGGRGARWWMILIGGEGQQRPSTAPQSQRFYPETITVNVGDTVEWFVNVAGPHTVTFPALSAVAPALRTLDDSAVHPTLRFNQVAILPQGGTTFDGSTLTGSGRLLAGPTGTARYRLTFTAPGTYPYTDLFQQSIHGTIVVLPYGSRRPTTQTQINAAAAQQLITDTAAPGQP